MGLLAPSPLVVPENPAEPIVQYEQELFWGRVGSIWLGRLAQGLEMGRLVSVRRVPSTWLTDQVRERTRKAARASVSFRHPTLLRMLGICELEAELLCVSEHLQSVLLDDLRRQLFESRTPLPVAVALRVVRDAARDCALLRRWTDERMLYCGQRLLYNDAIVVAAFGETLLRDVFLLTALCQSPTALASPSVIAGLSPEELSGPKALHPASEVFSLGVLLWELLANRPLFSLRDLQRATSHVISQPIPRLDRVERVGLPMPKEIASLVARALDRDPRRRIPSLEAFADAIEELPAHFVASTDQVGNCIRRLAGGFLGETDKSSRWPIRTSSDASALLAAHESRIEEKAHNWEPETVAERQLLSSSGLEISRAVESRPSAFNQRRASERTFATLGADGTRQPIIWGVALALVTSLLLALYLWRTGTTGLPVPFNRATPRPAPRFEVPNQASKSIDVLGVPAPSPSLVSEPSVSEPEASGFPAASPDVTATKPKVPTSKQRTAPRRASTKSRSGSKTLGELVPEQRWGI